MHQHQNCNYTSRCIRADKIFIFFGYQRNACHYKLIFADDCRVYVIGHLCRQKCKATKFFTIRENVYTWCTLENNTLNSLQNTETHRLLLISYENTDPKTQRIENTLKRCSNEIGKYLSSCQHIHQMYYIYSIMYHRSVHIYVLSWYRAT